MSINTKYASLLAPVDQSFLRYIKGYDVTLILAYFIAFLICYVAFPLIFGYGRTIGMKILSMVKVDQNFDKLSKLSNIIRNIIMFLAQTSILLLILIFANRLKVLSYQLIGPITFMQILIPLLLAQVVSLVIYFINKDNRCLSDIASGAYTIDLKKTRSKENG